jgi:hypothetical protein
MSNNDMMGELVRRERHYRHKLVGPGMKRGSRLSKNIHICHGNSFVERKIKRNKQRKYPSLAFGFMAISGPTMEVGM